MFVNVTFADIGFLSGYGVSSFNAPSINHESGFSHNIFFGIEKPYQLNQSESLILSKVLSTNRRFSTLYLTNLISYVFQKELTSTESIGLGFHLSYLINEDIDAVNLDGFGFGLNFKYQRLLTDELALNLNIQSTAYDVVGGSMLLMTTLLISQSVLILVTHHQINILLKLLKWGN